MFQKLKVYIFLLSTEFVFSWTKFILPFVIGSILGLARAYFVEMEQMPQVC